MKPRPWSFTSFRTQIVISTICLVAFAMILLALGVQIVLASVVSGNVDAVLVDRADAAVSAFGTAPNNVGFEVRPSTLEPGDTVYSATGKQVAGDVSPKIRKHADSLRLAQQPTTVNVGETHRLLAVPFTLPAAEGAPAASGVIVVSERLQPYEQSETYALLASIALGLVVTIAAGFVVRWVTHRALAPVAVMAERAADWSEHDLAKRFELGKPTNEITALGSTLDQLLERVSMAIRAEQRLTAELAHELRTPLTAIQGAADLALMRGGMSPAVREDLEQVAQSSRTMGSTITALLELARAGITSPGNATSQLGDVVRLVTDERATNLCVELGGHEGVLLAAPAELAARAISPILENALRHARTNVTVSCELSATHVDILVDDDGSGLTSDDPDTLFVPGTSDRDTGTGLGLGIARRTARSLGGDVNLADRPNGSGGARFVIRLPRVGA